MSNRKPAMITGLGVVAPNGIGVDEYWKATVTGSGGIGAITRFDADAYPTRLAGEVDGFEADQYISPKLLPQTDRMTRMSLAASCWALADAGVEPDATPEYEMSVCTASSSGGFEFGQRELQKLWGSGPEHVSAYQSFAWFYAVNTGQISIRHGMRGPSSVLVADQAGGLDALAKARRQLDDGSSLVVSGAIDSAICPWGWVAHIAGGRMTSETDPTTAYRPFDAEASGHVVGEGGAIIVLEDNEIARDRTTGYGFLAGHAATFDGADAEPGTGLRRAAELALADADLAAGDIGVVLADAAGAPEPDAAEAAALRDLFGPHGVPVTAPKTMTGRLLSGGAPLDVVAALLSMRDGVIPPTINVASADPALELDLVVGEPREATLDAALVLARGEGGFNSAAVLTRTAA